MPTEPEAPKLKQKSPAFKPFLVPLTPAEAAVGRRFLRAFSPPRPGGRAAARFLLRLRLLYECFRLGADAQSLYLLKAAAGRGLAAPPLTIGQYLRLLALSAGHS